MHLSKLVGPYSFAKTLRASRYTGSFIVIPKMTDDKPANNSFLCYEQLPSFAELPYTKVFTAVHKACLVSEIYLDSIYNKYKDIKNPNQYIALCKDLELLGVPLSYVFNNTYLYNVLKVDDHVALSFSKAFKHWTYLVKSLQRSEQFSLIFNEPEKFEGMVPEEIMEVMTKYNNFYRHNGFGISKVTERSNFFLYCDELETSTMKYTDYARRSSNVLSVSATDLSKDYPNILGIFHLGKNFKNGRDLQIHGDTSLVESLLKFCPQRAFRWKLWQAYLMIGVASAGGYHGSNAVTIGVIRHQCYRRAILLGFENATEMAVCGTLAGSVSAVEDFLYGLRDKIVSSTVSQLEQLQKFAESWGFSNVLEEHDISYWRRVYEEKNCNLTYLELAKHFPFENVIDGLFGIFENVFGVKFTENEDVTPWHDNVRCFDIIQSGRFLGSFYLDPFRHSMKRFSTTSFCLPVRGRSDPLGVTPAYYISLNICHDPETRETLVPYDFLEDMCFQFSRMFHLVVTSPKFNGISGVESTIPDLEHFAPQVLTHFCLLPENLVKLSGSLPPDHSVRVVKAKKFLSSLDYLWCLYFSMFDLELHRSTKHWELVQKFVWEDFMLFGQPRDDFRILNRADLMSADKPGSGYGRLWSKVMAVNAIGEYEKSKSLEFIRRLGYVSKISQLDGIKCPPDLDRFASYLF